MSSASSVIDNASEVVEYVEAEELEEEEEAEDGAGRQGD